MKIELKEFEKLLALAKSLPAGEREQLVALLKSYDVFEKDADGNEIEVKVDFGAAPKAGTPAPVGSLTPEQVQAIVEKAIKDTMPKPERKVTPDTTGVKAEAEIVVPDTAIRLPNMKGFRGERDGMTAEKRAFAAGQWLLSLRGNERAKNWCLTHGITKTHNITTDSAGGYLVPNPFLADLINLVNEYGVFRQYARVVPMTADTLVQPRVSGRLTAYFTNENTTATTSDATFDRISLTAKKLMVSTAMTSEVNEDSAINLAEFVFRDIARAFGYTEDDCGFNGDGTGTYGSIDGVRNRLSTVNGVDEGGGLVLGAGNAYSEITLADLGRLVGTCPTYALGGAAWFCSPLVFNSVLQRLAYASGGTTTTEVKSGDLRPNFLGYPVALTEVMPTTAANSQIAILFGDLSQAATFGDRRMPSIFTSEHVYATQDAIYVRGTERFDINVNDVGTSTVAGPIVGLITASS